MRRGLVTLASLGLLAAAGCGEGSPPELSDLSTSSRRAQIGTEVFLRAHVQDLDGDLDGGRLLARVRSDAGGVDLDGEAPIVGFEDGRLEGDVIVGLRLTGAVDLGGYDVSLTAEDGSGDRSETLTERMDYQF